MSQALNEYIEKTKNRLKKYFSNNEIENLLTEYPITSYIKKNQTDYFGYANTWEKGKYAGIILYRTTGINPNTEKKEAFWLIMKKNKFDLVDTSFIRKYCECISEKLQNDIFNNLLGKNIYNKNKEEIEEYNNKKKENESFGEYLIRKYLDNNKIKYIQEYEINNLVGILEWIKPPRYDFVLLENDKIIGAIEYDGKQHETNNILSNKRDGAKDAYAHLNFPLGILRISFEHQAFQDIKIIINEFLKNKHKEKQND